MARATATGVLLPGGAWIENILYNFSFAGGGTDGAAPAANVIFDTAGNIYGTTTGGGGGLGCACGTVFQLAPPPTAGPAWTETVLHSFPAATKDAVTPSSGPILWKNGVLYGVAQAGGAGGTGAVFGVVK